MYTVSQVRQAGQMIMVGKKCKLSASTNKASLLHDNDRESVLASIPCMT